MFEAAVDETRLLCRRSSSASSVRTGDEEPAGFFLGLPPWCSKRAMASDTGTLLGVVWFRSSSSSAIWFSSRSASRSMTWSIDERRRWWPWAGMVVVVVVINYELSTVIV